MKTYPVILGTAGHIDHGKTTLVKALTGIDTDRLKEEKERGITIELGFAYLDLGGPDGLRPSGGGAPGSTRRFGLVDVPGHERFLKAMVAGAGGVDVVMLVVAADEGVMPQTREHLDICQLLGIRRGVVALTKRDLVEESFLELAVADVKDAVAGTFLEDARIVPVSATSGAGLDDLRAELVRLADAVPARSADGLFRLPLDRVFTMKGFGTVVTGTILGGRVKVGDDVIVLPDERGAKVRGLEVHGEAVTEARAGMRCAMNLGGVERADVARGDLVAHAGTVTPSHLVDVRLRYLTACKAPLPRRAKALVHHATAQVMAQVVLVDTEELAPGEQALAQLHLETPVAALPGDHFIVRGFVPQDHYGTTIGGGEVLRVHAPKVRRSSEEAATALARLEEAKPAERVALEVLAAGPAGAQKKALHARLGFTPQVVDAALGTLTQTRELLRAEGDVYLHAQVQARLEGTALAAVDAFHAAQPHKEGIQREELRGRLPRALAPRLYEAVLEGLVRRGAIVAERDVVRRAKHAPAQATARTVSPLVERLVEKLRAARYETPRPQDLPGELGEPDAQIKAALDLAMREGKLVKIRPDYVVERGVLDGLRAELRAHLSAHGQITPQEWKTMTGVSRKYSIPLAEHFDVEKITLRVGEVRKLRG